MRGLSHRGRHIDRVGLMMRGEAATNTCLGGELAQLTADSGRRPCSTAGRAVDDAEQRPDLDSMLEPAVDVVNPQSSIPQQLSIRPVPIA